MIKDVISHMVKFARTCKAKSVSAFKIVAVKAKEIAVIVGNFAVKLFETALALGKRFWQSPRYVKIITYSVVGIAVALIGMTAAGARFCLKVNYEGSVIATVKNKNQFARAVSLVEERVGGEDVASAVSEPSYSVVITLNSNISKDEEVAEQIIEKSSKIVSATAVLIDGETVAQVDTDEVNKYLDARYASAKPEGVECEVKFEENVKFEEGYFVASDVEAISAVEEKLSALTLKAVATVTSDVTVPYKTVTKTTDSKSVGYQKTQVKGQNGTNRITEEIVYVNGEEESRKTLSTIVVSKPVDEVLLVGNAKATASKSEITFAKNSGFIFPLPNGSWQVSAWWGDGRNHQALDIRAPKGTSIFAVADGVVTDTGYTNSYGYYVMIRHNNGITTMYAHASQLCVKEGESVKSGDVIALVGRTGNATGNHLHFEVIVNGVRKNPAPYLGLSN
ncbi:MAG: peptidoglycan DD-metalloendopeptidase family protein [Clostridia bacterium]|nr:peptidoglycan DD-metalloendopeptidase family protein [Clostridia bacterium]